MRIARILFLVIIIAMTIQPTFSENDLEAKWAQLMEVTRSYFESSDDFWNDKNYQKFFREIDSGALPFLEKTYRKSNNFKERIIAIHLIGDLSQDPAKVWRIHRENRHQGDTILDCYVIYYLRNWENQEYINFCKEIFLNNVPTLGLHGLSVLVWQGANITGAEILQQYQITKDSWLFIEIGQLGDQSVRSVLWGYTKFSDEWLVKNALCGLALMRDQAALKELFIKHYMVNYDADMLVTEIIGGAQTNEIIEMLIADAQKQTMSLYLLLLVSKRIDLYELKSFHLRGWFYEHKPEWEKELGEIKGWWRIHKQTWQEPRQRIIVEPFHPYLGEAPRDIVWLDLWSKSRLNSDPLLWQ